MLKFSQLPSVGAKISVFKVPGSEGSALPRTLFSLWWRVVGWGGAGMGRMGWEGEAGDCVVPSAILIRCCSALEATLGCLPWWESPSESLCLLNSGPMMIVLLIVCLLSTWDRHRFRQLLLPSTPLGSQATRRSLWLEVMSPFKKTQKAI